MQAVEEAAPLVRPEHLVGVISIATGEDMSSRLRAYQDTGTLEERVLAIETKVQRARAAGAILGSNDLL